MTRFTIWPLGFWYGMILNFSSFVCPIGLIAFGCIPPARAVFFQINPEGGKKAQFYWVNHAFLSLPKPLAPVQFQAGVP
jgi:hypothetical protein